MNVRTNSILVASILGTIFFLFASVVATAISYSSTKRLIETAVLQGGSIIHAGDPFGLSILVSGFICVAWVLGGVGSGFLYPYFHRKETEPPQIDSVVVGGFCSGIIVGFMGAVINAFIQVIVLLPLQQQMISIVAASDPEMWLTTSMMAFKTGFNLLFNGVLMVLTFGILGVIGGIFGHFFFAQPPKPQKTPVS